METFVQYVVPILELIMSFIGVVFLFKPSTPSVNIDIGDKYYFTQNINKESNNSNSTNHSDCGPMVLCFLIFFDIFWDLPFLFIGRKVNDFYNYGNFIDKNFKILEVRN